MTNDVVTVGELQNACKELSKLGFELPITVYMNPSTKTKLLANCYAFSSFKIVTSALIPDCFILRELSFEDRRIYDL